MRLIRRFPAALWLPVFVGSIFILNGAQPRLAPVQLTIGLALTLVPFALSLFLALGPWEGRPKPSHVYGWFLGGTAAVYALAALGGWIAVGPEGAVVSLAAGLWPLTAVALWIATIRAKTVGTDARNRDRTATDHTDSAPGLGAGDQRPLGDTDEAHDEIHPRDLPKGHPGRAAAERLVDGRYGTTRGHAEGGAAMRGSQHAAADGDIVGEEEAKDGARVRR